MQTHNSNISILTDLLPQYRLINSLYEQVVGSLKLSFENQCHITDFYNTFKDRQAFEKAVLNLLLSTDKEKLSTFVTNLREEIGKNRNTYIAYKELFDGIDTLKVCTGRHEPFRIEIEGQLKDANKLWQELTQIRNSLESASWKNNQVAVQRLTNEEEKVETQYRKEQEKLDKLYQQQKESDKNASQYIKNAFEDIFELSNSFFLLLDNNYFLPNKNIEIKAFFENRYHTTIGQNFEPKRREPLLAEYKIVFYDYPF